MCYTADLKTNTLAAWPSTNCLQRPERQPVHSSSAKARAWAASGPSPLPRSSSRLRAREATKCSSSACPAQQHPHLVLHSHSSDGRALAESGSPNKRCTHSRTAPWQFAAQCAELLQKCCRGDDSLQASPAGFLGFSPEGWAFKASTMPWCTARTPSASSSASIPANLYPSL